MSPMKKPMMPERLRYNQARSGKCSGIKAAFPIKHQCAEENKGNGDADDIDGDWSDLSGRSGEKLHA